MYLETILILSKERTSVRAIDISEYMEYSKPSVSRAVGLLKQGEFIAVDKDGAITLTDAGREVAEKIYERHTVLTRTLVSLGVDEETAADDACRIEHDISDKSFEAIKKHLLKSLFAEKMFAGKTFFEKKSFPAPFFKKLFFGENKKEKSESVQNPRFCLWLVDEKSLCKLIPSCA